MDVENATLNSYRFPYGPRPTRIARNSIDARSSPKAATVTPSAARDRGVGDAASPVGADDGARDVTNDPVTPPVANAGCAPVAGTNDSSRRPFARRTAWPTCAANPIAVAMTPSTKRSEEACAISPSRRFDPPGWFPAGGGSVLGHAAAAPPDGGPARRIERVVGVSLKERPQLPHTSSAALRTRPHLGHATSRSSPDADRVAPGS